MKLYLLWNEHIT